MMAQVLLFNDFSKKDPHLNAIEATIHSIIVTALLLLKETQTFKTYWTESYKYCIIIAGNNTKI